MTPFLTVFLILVLISVAIMLTMIFKSIKTRNEMTILSMVIDNSKAIATKDPASEDQYTEDYIKIIDLAAGLYRNGSITRETFLSWFRDHIVYLIEEKRISKKYSNIYKVYLELFKKSLNDKKKVLKQKDLSMGDFKISKFLQNVDKE